MYKRAGRIPVQGAIEGISLSRIGVEVAERTWQPDILLREKSLSSIRSDDYVLVLNPKVHGFMVHIGYAQADEAKFRKMVETAIIEPIDTKVARPVRIITVANQVVALNKRIAEVQRLQGEQPGGQEGDPVQSGDMQHLANLLEEITRNKQELLHEVLPDVAGIQEIFERYKNDRELACLKKSETLVALQIERGVNDRPEQDNYRLKENFEILEKRIKSDTDMLESLEVLLAELGGKVPA